jgi:ribosome-associated toxin RatA of RatAB toxin-antitoxin module
MDICLQDTQLANPSAQTLFEVITDYTDYPSFYPAVVELTAVESSNS